MIPELGKMRQEDCLFKPHLDYMVVSERLALKTPNQIKPSKPSNLKPFWASLSFSVHNGNGFFECQILEGIDGDPGHQDGEVQAAGRSQTVNP